MLVETTFINLNTLLENISNDSLLDSVKKDNSPDVDSLDSFRYLVSKPSKGCCICSRNVFFDIPQFIEPYCYEIINNEIESKFKELFIYENQVTISSCKSILYKNKELASYLVSCQPINEEPIDTFYDLYVKDSVNSYNSVDLNIELSSGLVEEPMEELDIDIEETMEKSNIELEESIEELDLGLEEPIEELDLDLEESIEELDLDLEELDIGLEEPIEDLDVGLEETPLEELDIGLEEPVEELDIGLEESVEETIEELDIDLGLEESTCENDIVLDSLNDFVETTGSDVDIFKDIMKTDNIEHSVNTDATNEDNIVEQMDKNSSIEKLVETDINFDFDVDNEIEMIQMSSHFEHSDTQTDLGEKLLELHKDTDVGCQDFITTLREDNVSKQEPKVEEKLDLRNYLRRNPYTPIEEVLKFYSKKEVERALMQGKILKKNGTLRSL